MEFNEIEFDKLLEWKEIKIDLNDPRLKKYIFTLSIYDSLYIFNKDTFTHFSLIKNDRTNEYVLYNNDGGVITKFKDINLFINQLIRG